MAGTSPAMTMWRGSSPETYRPDIIRNEKGNRMAIEVAKIELKSVQDASGLEACIKAGQFAADQVIAVIGKTEGNGGVNDFTRILADQAYRGVLRRHGKRSEADVAAIPMVWSGGCDGVITPHATVFARNDKTGPASKSRLASRISWRLRMLCFPPYQSLRTILSSPPVPTTRSLPDFARLRSA